MTTDPNKNELPSNLTVNTHLKEQPFFKLLLLMAEWKKFIFINFLCVATATIIISFLLPKWYASSVSVIISTESSSLLGSLLSGESIDLTSLGDQSSDIERRLMAILESRRLLQSVVVEFNLQEKYGTPGMEESIKALKTNINYEFNKNLNILSITAQYEEDSSKCMDMVNFIYERLIEIDKEIATEEARNNRLFIEKRYHQNLKDLNTAEEAMKEFQKKYGLIQVDLQTKATVEALAEIKAQIITSEIEMNIMKKTLGSKHPEVSNLITKIEELKKKENQLNSITDPNSVFIPMQKIPELGLEYLRIFREVTIQTKIQEFIIPQYEQAKLKEAKDTPIIILLDKAYHPEKRIKPKRGLIVSVASILSVFISIGVIILIDFWKENKRNETEIYKFIKLFIKHLSLRK